ncbi:MAG: tRNA lysidine(34) synthetase TilS [Pseudomonadota bacterium]
MSAQAVTARQSDLDLLGLDLIPAGARVTLGVSGGGDSMAMLHAVNAWAANRDIQLTILTVDHRLRGESAAEADRVASVCHERGLPHETLVWDTPKPSQKSARQARHRLLARKAFDLKSNYLLLGHTLNDVAETQAMRKSRDITSFKQVGPMPVSVSPVWPDGRGLSILRPLLLKTRHKLRRWLSEHSLEWIEDPSNQNEAYERPRIRRTLCETDTGLALTIGAIQSRAEEEATLASLLRECAQNCDPYGLIRVSTKTDRSILHHLFSILIPAAAGGDRVPRAHMRQDAITRFLDQGITRVTLGGAWLQRSEDDILIGRAPAKQGYALEDHIFDGRFERSETSNLPEETAPYLVRHALPPSRSSWRSLIPDRLNLHASALEANQRLLTTPRAASPS